MRYFLSLDASNREPRTAHLPPLGTTPHSPASGCTEAWAISSWACLLWPRLHFPEALCSGYRRCSTSVPSENSMMVMVSRPFCTETSERTSLLDEDWVTEMSCSPNNIFLQQYYC